MWPYFLLIILPPLICQLTFLFLHKKDKATRWGISTFFLVFLFLLMFRHESVGIDIENYHYMYDRFSDMTIQDILYGFGIEKGYSLWNKLCQYFSGDFQVFLALTAVFCVVPLWTFYYKRTENVLFTILLFLIVAPFTIYFSGLRQSMSMAFVFPAFIFVRDKRILPFAITVFFAFTFHQSGLIIALMYPLYHMKMNRVGVTLMVFLALLSFIGARYLFGFTLNFFGERYEERYGVIDNNGAYGMFVLMLLFFIYVNFTLDFEKLDREYKGLRNILAFVVLVQALASVNNLIMRINYYFMPLMPLLLAKTSVSPMNRSKNIVRVITIILSVYFAYRFVAGVYNGTIYDTDILQTYPWIPCWE